MKVTVGMRGDQLSVYVAKKDMEEPVIATERPEVWGGWVELSNGWRLVLPDLAPGTRLPITVDARRLAL